MNGSPACFLRRIQEGQESYQHHICLIGSRELSDRRRIRFLRDGNDPHSSFIQPSRPGKHQTAHLIGKRQNFSSALGKRAACQHFFHGPLGHHLSLPALILHHHAHSAPFKIEGNLIHLPVALHQLGSSHFFLLLNDSKINQVLQSGLEIAVEKSMAKYPVILFSVNIQMAFQDYPVLGQRSCFIRAENINGTQVLDGIQVLYNHLLPAHGQCPFCQGCGYDHGQHFRSQAHRNRDGKQCRLDPVVLGESVQKQHHGNHNQHKANQNPGHGMNSLFKGGFRRLFLQLFRHFPHQGIASHCCRKSCGASADHIAPHKRQIFPICQRSVRFFRLSRLFHRFTFPGQSRLADKQISGTYDSQICRNHVTGRKQHQIPNHQFFHGDLLHRPLTHHAGRRMDQTGKPFCHIGTFSFLNEPQNAGYRHHGDNNRCGGIVLFSRPGHPDIGDRRYNGQNHKNHRKGIHKCIPNPGKNSRFAFIGQDILSVRFSGFLYLLPCQTAFRRPECFEKLLFRHP